MRFDGFYRWQDANFAWNDARCDFPWANFRIYRNINGVVSDIAVLDYALTDDDFEELIKHGSPSSFAPFRRFEPGDYALQRALMQYVVETPTTDRLRLTDIETFVDVPDVIERGLIDTEAAAVSVTFDRIFGETPEVLVMVRSSVAASARPIVSNITTTGFDVEIRDDTDTIIDGTVSWLAHGY